MENSCLSIEGYGSAKNGAFGPGVRRVYILHYVLCGSGYFKVGSKKYRVLAGQSFITMPDTVAEYYPDKNDPWEYIWVDFLGSEIEDFLYKSGFSLNTPVSPKFGEELSRHFFEINKNCKLNTAAALLCAKAHLYMILSFFLEHFPSDSVLKNQSAETDEILKYISNNLHRHSVTVGSISKRFNIDRSTLYRTFIKMFNMSPTEYLYSQRMALAAKLLKNPELSVKAVAHSVSYHNQLYFSKVFKGFCGMSPTEFRNTLKNDIDNPF